MVGLLAVSGCPQLSDDSSAVGVDGSGTDEGVVVDDVPRNDCSLDPYEPNDSRVTAAPIDTDTTVDATLCAGVDEVDWWTLTLSASSYVGIEVLFEKDARDVALELWDPAGGMIDRSEGGADIQAIHELLGPGRYEILVERREGDPAYTLKTYALATATATPVQEGAVRVFCPRFDLDWQYFDAAPQSGLREDFGVGDEPDRWEPKAMLVQVLDGQANVLRGWGPLDETGCTPPVWTPSPNDTDFVLEYALWSHFVRPPLPDTFMIVYDCEQMQPCVLPRRYAGFETAQGAYVKETRVVATAEVGQQFREELLVYWATAFSESRVSMGVDAHIYARLLGSADQGGGQFVSCQNGFCPNGTSCEMNLDAAPYMHCRPKTRGTTNVGGHPTLDIAAIAVDGAGNSGAPMEKFTIAHELGHVQTLWVAGFSAMMADVKYDWCSANSVGVNHSHDSPEWQSAALVEGFGDFYAVAVFNELEDGAWLFDEDVENDTKRFQAQCQASLDMLMKMGKCAQPGDATMCTDAGASNQIDWAGTLWDFTKVVGESKLPSVLRLLSDAGQMNWDPGSTTTTAYQNILWAAHLRFPGNGDEFDAAAKVNGTNR